MKCYLVAIYDAKHEYFHMPIIVQDPKSACRSFTDAIDNPEHPFHQNPSDYELRMLAEINFQEMQPVIPELGVLVTGADYKRLMDDDERKKLDI